MNSKRFVIKIASVPYREELVAEIYYNHEQWIEISREHEEALIIRFFSPLNKKYWEFPCDEALVVLEEAKRKLLAMGDKIDPNISP